MHHLESEIDREQITMIALEEMVSENSFARLVDLFVEALPMEELGFTNVQHEKEGRPPYHPKVLLKLYMYGYRHGLRSSGKLHKACLVNVELWWLLKGLKPSQRTICYFRKNNSKAFRAAFRHFVLMLKDWNLIDGETIAIDSFKIRAQNSLKNNFNQRKIDRHVEYIETKINEYHAALELAENENTRTEIEQKIQHQLKKKEVYKSIEKELNENGVAQISRTDTDARAVVLHRNIVNVGYNVQAGCDSKHKLFINAQTGNVNDTNALADMAIEAKELLSLEHMNTLTDKGYTTAEEMARCALNNITTYSSPKESSAGKNDLFNLAIFRYNTLEDSYTCPADKTLTSNGNQYTKGKTKVMHYKTKECKGCTLRTQCTNAKNGRVIERGIHQKFIEENKKRVEQNPDYYRLRQQVTEHQFGTIKRQWGFTYTLMKGKENVLSEVNLIMMCYNLRRLMSILDKNDLKRRLKDLILDFLTQFDANRLFLRLLCY
ncbi:MAG: IS1182 family transposase [Crocinitomicaceae bacterium]